MAKKAKTKVNKLSEEQLSNINDKQVQINDALHRVGLLEMQKEGVKHMLEDLSKAMDEMKKELEQEYGSINIDLKTGEYTPIEKAEVEEKKGDK